MSSQYNYNPNAMQVDQKIPTYNSFNTQYNNPFNSQSNGQFNAQQSFSSNNNNINQVNKTVDPKKAVDNFVTEYYQNATNIGWNNLSGLYFPNATIMIKNSMIGNHHNFVSVLAQNYIKRAVYGEPSSKWVVVDNTIVLNIFGLLQFVNFIGGVSPVGNFTETFILKLDENGKIKISVQMLDF